MVRHLGLIGHLSQVPAYAKMTVRNATNITIKRSTTMTFKLPEHSKMHSNDFIFGAATASFQIEGANTADGRCESIWDRFCATPGKVFEGHDGSIACDHYNRLEEDLNLMSELGLEAYRFSVAWPRIEPTPGQWNEKGFAFYERLIDGLLARGIKPFLTLYHWDLPQWMEDRGGWMNRDTAYRFAEYADKISKRFGDKVVSYCTFNEPMCSAFVSYRWGAHAPGYKDERMAFQTAHHLMLAHGLAMPLLRQNAPKAEHGIVLNFTPAFKADDSVSQDIIDFANNDEGFWFMEPLMKGAYPKDVWAYREASMPSMMPGDLDIISQPIDYLGINYYSRCVIKANEKTVYEHVPQDAPKTDIGWEIYPDGLTHLMQEMHRRYDNMVPIYITENGACDNTDIVDGSIDDTMRTDYYQQHLLAVDNAMESGVKVKGYFAWSLMDNFEWAFGYSMRFGIVHVNYDTLERTIKKSGKTWQSFLALRKA